jgi:hypothetical protein
MHHHNKGEGLNNPRLDNDIQPLALTERDMDSLGAGFALWGSPPSLPVRGGRAPLAGRRTEKKSGIGTH